MTRSPENIILDLENQLAEEREERLREENYHESIIDHV